MGINKERTMGDELKSELQRCHEESAVYKVTLADGPELKVERHANYSSVYWQAEEQFTATDFLKAMEEALAFVEENGHALGLWSVVTVDADEVARMYDFTRPLTEKDFNEGGLDLSTTFIRVDTSAADFAYDPDEHGVGILYNHGDSIVEAGALKFISDILRSPLQISPEQLGKFILALPHSIPAKQHSNQT